LDSEARKNSGIRFGQNDHPDREGRYWGWPEAGRLKNMEQEIKSLRLDFGQTDEVCERFIWLCLPRGSNVPGEPKLAAEFLADLSRTQRFSSRSFRKRLGLSRNMNYPGLGATSA
jgi:hypothetical protein